VSSSTIAYQVLYLIFLIATGKSPSLGDWVQKIVMLKVYRNTLWTSDCRG